MDHSWERPIGNNMPWAVFVDGKLFAGARTEEEARRMAEMYRKNVRSVNNVSANSKQTWTVGRNLNVGK